MAKQASQQLDDALFSTITLHTDRGNELFDVDDFRGAVAEYNQALGLVPQPIEDTDTATWILSAIGDCHFFLDEYDEALRAFSHAVACLDGLGNWFIHLRLGEIQFELGNLDRAADELARAYMGNGEEAFAAEDPKYYAFIRTKLRGLD